MELALGGYAGFHTTTPPTAESAYGVYWPTLVPAARSSRWSSCRRHHGAHRPLPGEPRRRHRHRHGPPARTTSQPDTDRPRAAARGRVRRPLGRQGRQRQHRRVDRRPRSATPGCAGYLTVDRFRELLPEAADLPVRRYELPNLRALNFVVVGLLGDGVASSTRPDPQAKGLGEYLRSRHTDIPTTLLPETN